MMQYNTDPQEHIEEPICDCGQTMELKEDGDDGAVIRFWRCPDCYVYEKAIRLTDGLIYEVKWTFPVPEDFKTGILAALKLNKELLIDNRALRLKELEQSDNVSGWISVKEQLPKAGDHVVVALKNGLFLVSLIRKDTGRWATAAEITHWMPLPPVPKEEVQP